MYMNVVVDLSASQLFILPSKQWQYK